MKAALITEKETISFFEFDDPDPDLDQVVVEITLCGICGTDIHGFNTPGPMRASICGHEWTGIVSKTGDEVGRIKEGDRVVVAVPPSCGLCVSCQAGQMDKCNTVLEATVAAGRFDTPHGGFAPRIAVNHWRTVIADSRLSDSQAAQIEPTTICFHAVRSTSPKLGDVVLVQGAGPIGLTTLQWAQVAGAGTVISVEPDPVRREVALSLGADYAVEAGEKALELVQEVTKGLGADVVYECAGVAPALQSAVDFARRGGTVSLIGLAASDALTKPAEWLRKEINVSASLGYTHEEFEMAMSYVANSEINLDAIHTGTVPLKDIDKAFSDLSSGTSGELKILVDPR